VTDIWAKDSNPNPNLNPNPLNPKPKIKAWFHVKIKLFKEF